MTTRSSSSASTNYSWDTSSDLPQLAMEGSLSYTYGEGTMGFVTGSGSYAYHTDSLGSVVELSDSNGNSVESYRYSPYGEADSEDGSSQADSSLGNSLRYAGQYLDSETDLYDMRAREYDPEVGRFLEIDPLEAAVGDPSVGVYVYVDDQPTVLVDPSGEAACGAQKKPPPNGCGPGGWIGSLVPDKLPGFFNFRKACNWHDKCYGGWGKRTRLFCDNHFRRLMGDECAEVYDCPICLSIGGCGLKPPGCDTRYNICERFANKYRWAVRSRLGKKVFRTNQFEACPWRKKNPKRCWKSINARDD